MQLQSSSAPTPYWWVFWANSISKRLHVNSEAKTSAFVIASNLLKVWKYHHLINDAFRSETGKIYNFSIFISSRYHSFALISVILKLKAFEYYYRYDLFPYDFRCRIIWYDINFLIYIMHFIFLGVFHIFRDVPLVSLSTTEWSQKGMKLMAAASPLRHWKPFYSNRISVGCCRKSG